MSLRDLLNRAALAIDSVPDPSLSDLKLIVELRNYVIVADNEWQRRALRAEAEVAELRCALELAGIARTQYEIQVREQNAADWAERDALAGAP
jgi:hypothetical protein